MARDRAARRTAASSGFSDLLTGAIDQARLREQIADVSGQEILTADKVTLRINLVVAWRITDPVLATEVQVDNPTDRDQLRFALTGEGGLNDGTAFPVVMLGLGLLGAHDLGTLGWRWYRLGEM